MADEKLHSDLREIVEFIDRHKDAARRDIPTARALEKSVTDDINTLRVIYGERVLTEFDRMVNSGPSDFEPDDLQYWEPLDDDL